MLYEAKILEGLLNVSSRKLKMKIAACAASFLLGYALIQRYLCIILNSGDIGILCCPASVDHLYLSCYAIKLTNIFLVLGSGEKIRFLLYVHIIFS